MKTRIIIIFKTINKMKKNILKATIVAAFALIAGMNV